MGDKRTSPMNRYYKITDTKNNLKGKLRKFNSITRSIMLILLKSSAIIALEASRFLKILHSFISFEKNVLKTIFSHIASLCFSNSKSLFKIKLHTFYERLNNANKGLPY